MIYVNMEDHKIDNIEQIHHRSVIDQRTSIRDFINEEKVNNAEHTINIHEEESPEFTTLRQQIIRDHIVPAYKSDVKESLTWRSKWKTISDYVEGFAYFLIGISGLFSFAASAYPLPDLSFVAGCCIVVAGSLKGFSTYAKAESKERTIQTNKILDSLGIDNIPDINIENLGSTVGC